MQGSDSSKIHLHLRTRVNVITTEHDVQGATSAQRLSFSKVHLLELENLSFCWSSGDLLDSQRKSRIQIFPFGIWLGKLFWTLGNKDLLSPCNCTCRRSLRSCTQAYVKVSHPCTERPCLGRVSQFECFDLCPTSAIVIVRTGTTA